jgi:hypothetical protein
LKLDIDSCNSFNWRSSSSGLDSKDSISPLHNDSYT